MQAPRAFACLLLGAVITPTVLFAQSPGPSPDPPPHRARVGVERLTPAPTTSFAALPPILETGYEVVVRDAAGRGTRGRVSAISGDHVVIFSERATPLLRLTRPAVERRFPADSVERIEIVDSTWNGTLIGAGVGVGLAVGIARWESSATPDGNSMKGLGTLVFGALSIVACSAAGHHLDLSMNAPVYRRPSQAPRVSLVPLLGRERVGVLARVQF